MRLKNKARTALAMIGPARPIILYHKPTSRCDCRCQFCDTWKQPGNEEVLPSPKAISLLDRLLSCNRCLLPCVANMADGLVLQTFRRAFGQLYYRAFLSGRGGVSRQ